MGIHAVVSDLEQLYMMDIFAPLCNNKLTRKDRAYDLVSLMFLTEKMDGIIKKITCDDVIKQWSCIEEKMMHPQRCQLMIS